MRRRILVAILSVTFIAIALFAIPLGIVVGQLVGEDAALKVERQAVLAARQVPADFATRSDPVELPTATDGVHLALYDAEGMLVTGVGPAVVEAELRGSLANRVIDAEPTGRRVVAVPVAADEQVIGLIRAEQPTASSDRRTLSLLAFLGGVAVAVLVVGAIIGSLLAGRLARPVRRLRDAAVELGRGNFTVQPPLSNIPEIDDAGAALVTTGATLDDLISRERAFSADASHQLRTPIAGMRAAVETELRFPREDHERLLHEVLTDLDRLEITITELLSLARTPNVADTALHVSEVVDELAAVWAPRLAQHGRTLSVDVPGQPPAVWANASMLKHVLDVLLDNALRHGRGEVRLVVTSGGPQVTVTITDQGGGFDPSPSSGTGPDRTHGHGLLLATRYAEAMLGRLVVGTAGSTSRVDVVLRRASDASSLPPLA